MRTVAVATSRMRLMFSAVLLLATVEAVSGADRPADALISPFDTSLYRPEAVRQIEGIFGDWLVKCQEIIPLNRRFCNIVAPLKGEGDAIVGSLLLSTDKAGKPGILMKLGGSIVVGRPTTVSTSFEVKTKKKPARISYEKTFQPRLCGTTCDYVFPLERELVFALNEGEAITVAYFAPVADDWRLPGGIRRVVVKASGAQFAAALAFSMAPAPAP